MFPSPYLYSTTFVNVGTMKNSGLELDIHWTAVNSQDFVYSIDFAGSSMDNEFVSFSNSEYRPGLLLAGTEDPFPFHYLQENWSRQRDWELTMWKLPV